MPRTKQTEVRADEVAAEIRDLTVSYLAGGARVNVVDGVSFALRRGRTLGLVGESGSGKSTAARTLLGHLRAGSRLDGGQVSVHGEDVFALPPDQLRRLRGGTVALVSQNAGDALTPSMRVETQLAEALRAHGLPAGRDRIAELIELVRLRPEVIGRRYPHELSGGQQQRVAIAMAVATDPDVLVLDEPTTALDVITQAAVLGLIDELRERLDMAVLIVSHDLGVVSALADDVVVLREGKMVEQGPTEEVLGSPAEDYTRDLLAAVPRIHLIGQAPRPRVDGATEVSGDQPLISCDGLDIRYPGAPRPAVAGFRLRLERGESVAVVGESGSGKSTVAAAFAGLARAERGTAILATDGSSHDLLAPVARRGSDVRWAVQLIFQNADLALNPRRTVGDAIARPLRVFGHVRGRRAAREAVAALLTEVGLGPRFADRLPAQLSGGQRQRVGIARALAAEPAVLIADEITTALDVSVQADVLDLLERLRTDRGLASVFISHDLGVVRRVADRIIVMKDGHIVETAPTDVLFDDPRHPYTRMLLDAVLEPGAADLSTTVEHPLDLAPDAELVDVGGGHHVRSDEGVTHPK
ncbi:MAG: ABC transporter ATP-binding protein [Actinomycetota bacterium]|nr:ABC transporter ATP-binding protein [Actinomycetota bacterium]